MADLRVVEQMHILVHTHLRFMGWQGMENFFHAGDAAFRNSMSKF